MAATVRVVAFAQLRDVLGFGARDVASRDGMTIADLWNELAVSAPALRALRASTRFARNGEVTSADSVLDSGDEVALLPPVGGG